MIKKRFLNPFFKGSRGEKGFTLIEILIALVILTIALLGLANLLYTVIKGNTFSDKMTLAVTRAQGKIEQFKNTGYAALSTTPDSDTPDTGLSRSWTVTDNSPANNMKSVTVTVSWTDLHNKSRSISLSTIISQ